MDGSSIGSVQDLRTEGRWFNPWLSQYSLPDLMTIIAAGFIPLTPILSIVSPTFVWESSQ